MSRRGGRAIIAAVLVALVVLGWAIVPGVIHRQILLLGATDIHDAATLPDQISVCGRDWKRDALDRHLSRAGIQAWSGAEPVLVDPLPFAPCPNGPCTQAAQNGPCNTVVFVRVGEDVYVDYALQGGA